MKKTYIRPVAVACSTAITGHLLAGSVGGPDITDSGLSGNDPNTAKRKDFIAFDEEADGEDEMHLLTFHYSVWD